MEAEDAGRDDIVSVARAFEPERYLSATLSEEPTRDALIALAGFAADLQRITTSSSLAPLGEIRLQWWRDSLDTVSHGGTVGSPLASALGDAIRSFDLPVAMLSAMTEARAWELYSDPMPDEASLGGFYTKTEAIPFELALRVLGVPAADAGAMAEAAGRCFGSMRMLARLPVHLAAGRVPYASTTLAKAGLQVEDLVDGKQTQAVHSLVSSQSERILDQLAQLRGLVRRLDRHQRVALLPLAVVSPYLKTIRRRDRNPLRDVAELAPLTRIWRIGRGYVAAWI
jgi:15-cis-phytoene synthase